MSSRDDRYPRPGRLFEGPIFPGQGYPANPGEGRPGGSPFGRLAKGQPLGKSSILIYDANSIKSQPSAVQMLQIEGDDLDATQILITLASPRVIPRAFTTVGANIDQQGLSGEQDNAEIAITNFPGDLAPIAWPPLEAVIEWGVRGASARAVIDYVNGMTVNVVASFVRVWAVVTQNGALGGIVGTSAAYYLAAFAGPGWAKTGTAQRTVYVGTIIGEAESIVFDVPKFARRAFIVSNDDAATPLVTVATLRFWQSPDGTNNVGNYLQTGNQPIGFDVPNAAQYFSVINGTETTARYSVIFELSI